MDFDERIKQESLQAFAEIKIKDPVYVAHKDLGKRPDLKNLGFVGLCLNRSPENSRIILAGYDYRKIFAHFYHTEKYQKAEICMQADTLTFMREEESYPCLLFLNCLSLERFLSTRGYRVNGDFLNESIRKISTPKSLLTMFQN